MPVIIEPLNAKHLDTVVKIETESFPQPWSLKSFLSELENNQLAVYLAAVYNDRVVGYGGVWVILDDAHITTLAVDSRYRRLGVATNLLKALIDKAEKMGAKRLSLEVRPSNTPARRLYEKFGFTVKGIRKHYYFNEDGLVMFKESMDSNSKNEPAS